jgi:hypothetical protein
MLDTSILTDPPLFGSIVRRLVPSPLKGNISLSLKTGQMFSSFAGPGDLESHSLSLYCDTSVDSNSVNNTTSFSRCVDVEYS